MTERLRAAESSAPGADSDLRRQIDARKMHESLKSQATISELRGAYDGVLQQRQGAVHRRPHDPLALVLWPPALVDSIRVLLLVADAPVAALLRCHLAVAHGQVVVRAQTIATDALVAVDHALDVVARRDLLLGQTRWRRGVFLPEQHLRRRGGVPVLRNAQDIVAHGPRVAVLALALQALGSSLLLRQLGLDVLGVAARGCGWLAGRCCER